VSDISALKKMKAQFELKPLIAEGHNVDDLPESAVNSSAMAMNILQTFFSEIEAKRNESEL
jgi:hypothetical protein